jgi:methionyl-tRNA formyltransferase
VRIAFAGTPEVALPALQALLGGAHEVVAVITRPDAPSGRGRQLSTSPVKDLAAGLDLPVLQPGRPSDPGLSEALRDLRVDCVPVVAYGALVPQAVLDVVPLGWVNLHFSLLPAWRGAAPVQRAVLAGDEVTGATTFRLEAGMDTGPVYGYLTETVRPSDTSGDLLGRLAQAGAGLLVATLDAIADGSANPVPQSTSGVSLAPKLSVAEVRIDWAAPTLRVDRLVRAAAPAPGAWTTFRDARVKIGPVTPAPDLSGLEPAQLGDGRVGTGCGEVVLGLVKPEGKGWMPAAAWLNGARPTPGERFA